VTQNENEVTIVNL